MNNKMLTFSQSIGRTRLLRRLLEDSLLTSDAEKIGFLLMKIVLNSNVEGYILKLVGIDMFEAISKANNLTELVTLISNSGLFDMQIVDSYDNLGALVNAWNENEMSSESPNVSRFLEVVIKAITERVDYLSDDITPIVDVQEREKFCKKFGIEM